MPILVTIDGGAGAGKSSTAQALAKRLGLMHVDTGSHYRALALWLDNQHIPPEDQDQVGQALQALNLETTFSGQLASLTIDGSSPDPESLRSERINKVVSLYAAIPAVREKLKAYQQNQLNLATTLGYAGLVMEGRDIGSVIFPTARHRFFLEADPDTRARRRAADGEADAVSERDRLDSSRKTAPMHCPEGAIRIDTSHMTLIEVVDMIASQIETACWAKQ